MISNKFSEVYAEIHTLHNKSTTNKEIMKKMLEFSQNQLIGQKKYDFLDNSSIELTRIANRKTRLVYKN